MNTQDDPDTKEFLRISASCPFMHIFPLFYLRKNIPRKFYFMQPVDSEPFKRDELVLRAKADMQVKQRKSKQFFNVIPVNWH